MKWFEQLLQNNTAADWLAALLAALGVGAARNVLK